MQVNKQLMQSNPAKMQPQQMQQPMEQSEGIDDFGGGEDDIISELEAHLDTVDDRQKAFLVQALFKDPQTVIGIMGIVNGPEVANYFEQIYTSYAQNSSSSAGQPTGTPQPRMNVVEQTNAQFNPQAKATSTEM